MTDHRRRAEDAVRRGLFWTGDYREKDLIHLHGERLSIVKSVASALKEVEEETWARAIKCVEKRDEELDNRARFQDALDALREESRAV